MLTCRELTELITDYLEARMPWPRQVAFQLHLGLCRSCRAYLQQMRATIRATGQLREPPEAMPDELRDALLHRFRTWKGP